MCVCFFFVFLFKKKLNIRGDDDEAAHAETKMQGLEGDLELKHCCPDSAGNNKEKDAKVSPCSV